MSVYMTSTDFRYSSGALSDAIAFLRGIGITVRIVAGVSPASFFTRMSAEPQRPYGGATCESR